MRPMRDCTHIHTKNKGQSGYFSFFNQLCFVKCRALAAMKGLLWESFFYLSFSRRTASQAGLAELIVPGSGSEVQIPFRGEKRQLRSKAVF